MQIVLELQNPSKLDFILEFLKGLGDVKILQPKKNELSHEPKLAEPQQNNEDDFLQFYGCIQPQMGIEAVDKQLAELWEN